MFKNNLKTKFSLSTQLIMLSFCLVLVVAVSQNFKALFLTQEFGIDLNTIGLWNLVGLTLATIISFNSSYILNKFSTKKILFVLIKIFFLLFLLLTITDSAFLALSFLLLIQMLDTLRINTFNLLFRENVPEEEFKTSEEILFSFQNLGYAIIPIIIFVELFFIPNKYMFLTSLLFLIGAGVILFSNFKSIKSEQKADEPINLISNAKEFFNNKNDLILFILSAGIHTWWIFMSIYAPVLMSIWGFSNQEIFITISAIYGLIMFAEMINSKFVDKINPKIFLIIGYTIPLLAITSLILFESKIIIISALVLGTLGFSFIEPIREIIFFEETPKAKIKKLYPIFESFNPIGLLLGQLILGTFFFLNKNPSITVFHILFAQFSFLLLLSIYYFKKK